MTATKPREPLAAPARQPPLAQLVARLTLVSLRDGVLTATTPSRSALGTLHTITIPLDEGEPIVCSDTCQARGVHWHLVAADELRHRCRETLAVLRPSAPEFLRLQRAWLAPENVGGLTLAYLCACYLLDERAQEEREAA
jgi:hypothetical protein